MLTNRVHFVGMFAFCVEKIQAKRQDQKGQKSQRHRRLGTGRDRPQLVQAPVAAQKARLGYASKRARTKRHSRRKQ